MNTDYLADEVGENVKIQGEILKVSKKSPGTDREHIVMIMRQETYGRSRILCNSYLNYEKELVPGDYIALEGVVELPSVRRNPRCFDYSRYLSSIGIKYCLNVTNIDAVRVGDRFIRDICVTRNQYIDRLGEHTSEQVASMVDGILFGAKDGIDDEVMEDFQKNGTAHILAVSGLHIGIIYAFINQLWPFRKKWGYFCFNGCFFCIYCIMASFSPSVVRASIMVMLHCLARLTNRKYDLSSAAFAVLIAMLIINPMSLYNTGFQMSFLAVLSISLMLPYVKRIHDGFLSGSMAVQMGLLPFMMYTFNYLPAGALLINIPIMFLTGIIVPLGFASMMLPQLDDLLAILIEVMVRVNETTCIDGITTFMVTSPPLFLVTLFYLIMLVVLSEQGRLIGSRYGRRATRGALALCVGIAIVFSGLNVTGFEHVKVTFVDVGQGACIHVSSEEGHNYLIDGGGRENYQVGKKTLKPYLLKNGVRYIDAAIVTHLHTDHYRGIIELCQLGMIKNLFVYEGNAPQLDEIISETGLGKEYIHFVKAGDLINFDDETCAQIIWPEAGRGKSYAEDEENENCLVVELAVKGVKILVTGDIDSECEENLVSNHLCHDVDILQVAHHGSKYSWSDKFVESIKPEFAVIQVGRNNYGHPTREVLDGLNEHGVMTLRNDMNGAIGIALDDAASYEVVTQIK